MVSFSVPDADPRQAGKECSDPPVGRPSRTEPKWSEQWRKRGRGGEGGRVLHSAAHLGLGRGEGGGLGTEVKRGSSN